ncbi:hypothetical protein BDZ85DRAFT_257604 [Elsinoe ampelina]|uniref:Uncharacterized protein n=1 Tax=Elsinoe ampelina TaxID=302913 RepID=A0A6A6GIL4_9PEZI|nr:hypothetical protein BDZ85DRAFT_257604 [Elsinoe ampelina]
MRKWTSRSSLSVMILLDCHPAQKRPFLHIMTERSVTHSSRPLQPVCGTCLRRCRGKPFHDERVYIFLPVPCSSAAMEPGVAQIAPVVSPVTMEVVALVFPNPISPVSAVALGFIVWPCRPRDLQSPGGCPVPVHLSVPLFMLTGLLPGATSLCAIDAHLYSRVTLCGSNDLAFDASAGSLQ